jgi:hypothetical protein
VEKNQYELCLEVLRRFHKHKLLSEFILIGSWCIELLKDLGFIATFKGRGGVHEAGSSKVKVENFTVQLPHLTPHRCHAS